MQSRDNPWFLPLVTTGLAIALTAGYEVNLKETLFPYINIAAIGVFALSVLVARAGALRCSNGFPLLLFGATTMYALIAHLVRSSTSPEDPTGYALKLVAQFAVFSIALLVFSQDDTRALFKALSTTITIAAAIGLAVATFGSLLFWNSEKARIAGIFHDPNYAGVVFGFAFLFELTRSESRRGRWVQLTMLGVALLLTFSKGAILSVIVAVLWWSLRTRPIRSLSYSIPTACLVYFAYDSLLVFLSTRLPLLRIEMGLNSRDLFWSDAVFEILARPFVGNEPSAVYTITDYYDPGAYSSLHNFYLESTFLNGVPYLAGILALVFYSFRRSIRLPPWASVLTVFFVVASNNFTFSIGSVGLLPFIFTLAIVHPFQTCVAKLPVRSLTSTAGLVRTAPHTAI